MMIMNHHVYISFNTGLLLLAVQLVFQVILPMTELLRTDLGSLVGGNWKIIKIVMNQVSRKFNEFIAEVGG